MKEEEEEERSMAPVHSQRQRARISAYKRKSHPDLHAHSSMELISGTQ